MRAQGEDPQGGRKGLHTSHPPHLRRRSTRRGSPGRPQGSPRRKRSFAIESGSSAKTPRATARVSTPLIHLTRPYNDYGRTGSSGGRPSEEFEQKRTGFPFTFIGDWQNQIDHLLLQEEAKHHQLQAPPLLPQEEKQYEQELNMSMRPGVDKAAIEAFLQQLGRTFHKPARLYLVGGAALVHLGVRPGFTQDIDIQVGGINEGELIVAIQRLIDQMQINVEFASPVDFMPLPSGWERHARYV